MSEQKKRGRPRKDAAPGPVSPEDKAAWQEAAAASEAAAKGAQARLDFGDEVPVFQELEIDVPVSADEAELLDRKASDTLAKKGAKEAELKKLVADHVAPLKAEIAELDKEAAKAARESAERKRKMRQRVEVVYHPARMTVHFYAPGTDRKVQVQLSRAMTAAELQDLDKVAAGQVHKPAGAPPPPDDAERVEVE